MKSKAITEDDDETSCMYGGMLPNRGLLSNNILWIEISSAGINCSVQAF